MHIWNTLRFYLLNFGGTKTFGQTEKNAMKKETYMKCYVKKINNLYVHRS